MWYGSPDWSLQAARRARDEHGSKRRERQEALFVMAEWPAAISEATPFIDKLNELLAEADFDRWIEGRCRPYYATEEKRGQPSIPPGVYFACCWWAISRESIANAASLGGVPTA